MGPGSEDRKREGKIVRKPKTTESRELALELAKALEEKLAEGVVVLDMRKLMYLTDYFILATGRNVRHTQALANELLRTIGGRKKRARSVEGLPEGHWVLFDVGDVVVHLFDEETRAFYDLEHLWADAPRCRRKRAVRPQPSPET
jgi:ribosome-associated protein